MDAEWKYTNKRTFGFELEVADVYKPSVVLPAGYSWSADEKIVNSDGKMVGSASSRGGELNTKPLSFCKSDIEELRSVFGSLFENGGRCTWCHGFAVHIYAGDFSLEALKSVFILSYYTSAFIKQIADIGDWNESSELAPVPSIDFVVRTRNARTFEEIKNVFANSSQKGFFRHMVNITSYFKHGAIEFRIFNTTYNFEELGNSVLFAFRFVDYAVKHTEEDFAKIKTFEDFKRELKLDERKKLAPKISPLIFIGDPKSSVSNFIGERFDTPSGLIKALLINADGEELACVNPVDYRVELSVYKRKKITIFNSLKFSHVIYQLATGRLKLQYKGDFEWLEKYNGEDAQSQLFCLFAWERIRRLNLKTEYGSLELEAYKARMDESKVKMLPHSEHLIDLFANCDYVFGTLDDAILSGKNVFFQLDNYSRYRSAHAELFTHTNYCETLDDFSVDYYSVLGKLKENQQFLMVSENPWIDLKKLAFCSDKFLYANFTANSMAKKEYKSRQFASFKYPPEDLLIEDASKLKIERVRTGAFYELQKTFIKKVAKVQEPSIAFLVMYDDMCLGGFGFKTPKKETLGEMFLLSDFSTQNKINRLSKLILLASKTELVRKVIERLFCRKMYKFYTKVYTSRPVSMKYRGVFQKLEQEEKTPYLLYQTSFGDVSGYEELLNKYQKICQRAS